MHRRRKTKPNLSPLPPSQPHLSPRPALPSIHNRPFSRLPRASAPRRRPPRHRNRRRNKRPAGCGNLEVPCPGQTCAPPCPLIITAMGTSRVPEPGRTDPYVRMHSVTIYVRDQDRSIRFYVDQLGFTLAFDVRLQSGGRWVAISPPEGDTVITLVAPEPNSREYKLIGRATQITFVTENVLARYREWRQRGVHFQFTPRLKRVRYERLAPLPEAAAET